MFENQHDEIALSEAAQRLGISWQRAWRLVLTGALHGHQRGGRWYVQVDSVAAMKRAATDLPAAR